MGLLNFLPPVATTFCLVAGGRRITTTRGAGLVNMPVTGTTTGRGTVTTVTEPPHRSLRGRLQRLAVNVVPTYRLNH